MSLTFVKERDLRDLPLLESKAPTLSIYLPLDRTNSEARRIRLKNVIQQAEGELKKQLADKSAVAEFLTTLGQLQDHPAFTEPRYAGLALLADTSTLDKIAIFPLWDEPQAQVSLGPEPLLGPILADLSHPPVTLLCLSENELRLFRGHLGQMREETPPSEFPASLKEVIRFEESAGLDGNEHYRNRSQAAKGAVHGEGPTNPVETEFELRYLRVIGKALESHLAPGEKVMLAAVREKVALFQSQNDHLPFLGADLHGNVIGLTRDEVLQQANECLSQYNQETLQRELEELKELAPELRSEDTTRLAEAADEGRVSLLFVSTDDSVRYQSLLLKVLQTGGVVRIVDFDPDQQGVVGRLRW